MAVERIATQITLTAEANSHTLGEGPTRRADLSMSEKPAIELNPTAPQPQVPEATSPVQQPSESQIPAFDSLQALAERLGVDAEIVGGSLDGPSEGILMGQAVQAGKESEVRSELLDRAADSMGPLIARAKAGVPMSGGDWSPDDDKGSSGEPPDGGEEDGAGPSVEKPIPAPFKEGPTIPPDEPESESGERVKKTMADLEAENPDLAERLKNYDDLSTTEDGEKLLHDFIDYVAPEGDTRIDEEGNSVEFNPREELRSLYAQHLQAEKDGELERSDELYAEYSDLIARYWDNGSAGEAGGAPGGEGGDPGGPGSGSRRDGHEDRDGNGEEEIDWTGIDSIWEQTDFKAAAESLLRDQELWSKYEGSRRYGYEILRCIEERSLSTQELNRIERMLDKFEEFYPTDKSREVGKKLSRGEKAERKKALAIFKEHLDALKNLNLEPDPRYDPRRAQGFLVSNAEEFRTLLEEMRRGRNYTTEDFTEKVEQLAKELGEDKDKNVGADDIAKIITYSPGTSFREAYNAAGSDEDSDTPEQRTARQARRIELVGELYHKLADKLADIISPASPRVPDAVFEAVAGDPRAARKLTVRIISFPLHDKTKSYHLGFYPQNNLDMLRMAQKDWVDSSLSHEEHRERHLIYNNLGVLVEGINHMHNLHTMIGKSSLQDFARYAAELTGSHLDVMIKEQDVAIIQRIIENKFNLALARHSNILTVFRQVDKTETVYGEADTHNFPEVFGSEPGSYDEMFGFELGEGEDARQEPGSISELFDTIAHYGKHIPGLEKEFGVEQYQADFAKDISRYLYAILLRGAEKASMSEYQDSSDSFIARLPWNGIATKFNAMGQNIRRWVHGKTTGGQQWMDFVQSYYDKQRDAFGWHTPLVSRVQGIAVSYMEYAKMLGAQGFNRTWRERLVILRNAPFLVPFLDAGHNQQINPDTGHIIMRTDSLTDYLGGHDVHGRRGGGTGRRGVRDEIEILGKSDRVPEAIALLKSTFLNEAGEVLPQWNNALGVILQMPILTPTELDKKNMGQEYTDAVLEVRTAFFRNVTSENTVVMASYVNKAEPSFSTRGLDPEDPRQAREIEERDSDWLKAMKGRTKEEIGLPSIPGRAATGLYARREALDETLFTDAIWTVHPVSGELSVKYKYSVDLDGRDKVAWKGSVAHGHEMPGLEAKLTLAREVINAEIMRNYKHPERYKPVRSLEDVLNTLHQGLPDADGNRHPIPELADLELKPEERDLFERIKEVGNLIAPDLATIRFPHTPFMDVLWETAKFKNGGEEAFKDTFPEVGAYAEVQQKVINLIIDPADKDPEDAIKEMAGMVPTFGDPLGIIDAQDLLNPIFLGYLRLIELGGMNREKAVATYKLLKRMGVANVVRVIGARLMGFGNRERGNKKVDSIYSKIDGATKVVKQTMEQTNLLSHIKRDWFKLGSSPVQYATNGKGPALDAEQEEDLIKKAQVHGVIRKALYDGRVNTKDAVISLNGEMVSFGEHNISQVLVRQGKWILRKVGASKIPGLKELIEEERHWYIHTPQDKDAKNELKIRMQWIVKMLNFLFIGSAVTALEALKEGADETLK